MNRQASFNFIFLVFMYSVKNKLINIPEIILLLEHISNYFYVEFYNLLTS
jgi:hypothetical protein